MDSTIDWTRFRKRKVGNVCMSVWNERTLVSLFLTLDRKHFPRLWLVVNAFPYSTDSFHVIFSCLPCVFRVCKAFVFDAIPVKTTDRLFVREEDKTGGQETTLPLCWVSLFPQWLWVTVCWPGASPECSHPFTRLSLDFPTLLSGSFCLAITHNMNTEECLFPFILPFDLTLHLKDFVHSCLLFWRRREIYSDLLPPFSHLQRESSHESWLSTALIVSGPDFISSRNTHILVSSLPMLWVQKPSRLSSLFSFSLSSSFHHFL